MIVDRHTTVSVPSHQGRVTLSAGSDGSSATWAAQRNCVIIEQGGDRVTVLETEVSDLVEALVYAASVFKGERETRSLRAARERREVDEV